MTSKCTESYINPFFYYANHDSSYYALSQTVPSGELELRIT